MQYVRFGRRRGDFGLAVDFHLRRAAVRSNILLIEGGVRLEEVEQISAEYAPGIVLVHGDWKEIYFVRQRPGWTEDEYFDHAEKLMKEQAITNP